MYKVQNMMPGNLPIDLEEGSITLTAGQTFDLDTRCSRKWIKTNILLKKLFDSKALRLIHDSAASIPKVPVRKVRRIKPGKRTKKAKKPLPKPVSINVPVDPTVTDLSAKEDPTEKKYKRSKKKAKKTEKVSAKSLAEKEETKKTTKKKKEKTKSSKTHSSFFVGESSTKKSKDVTGKKKKRKYKRGKSTRYDD